MASGLIPGTPVGQLFSRSSQPSTPTLQDIQENNLGGVSSGHAIPQLHPENSQCVSLCRTGFATLWPLGLEDCSELSAPVPHEMHCDWPSELVNDPTGQGKHVPLRGKANDPAEHGVHDVRLRFTCTWLAWGRGSYEVSLFVRNLTQSQMCSPALHYA